MSATAASWHRRVQLWGTTRQRPSAGVSVARVWRQSGSGTSTRQFQVVAFPSNPQESDQTRRALLPSVCGAVWLSGLESKGGCPNHRLFSAGSHFVWPTCASADLNQRPILFLLFQRCVSSAPVSLDVHCRFRRWVVWRQSERSQLVMSAKNPSNSTSQPQNKNPPQPQAGTSPSGTNPSSAAFPTPEDALVYQGISGLVSKCEFEQACRLLNANFRGIAGEHARAVCLIRLGHYLKAIEILRGLVLSPGCTWMRPDVPLLYKTNFATALLMGGHPAGCRSILGEIMAPSDPSVMRLQATLNRWEGTLSFWERINWRWFSIEPANRPVPVDSAGDQPGDFFRPMPLEKQ